jgi:hypothetical protein
MENSEPSRQLTSWKEIAQYLGRDIRTCWRWEKQYGLPVHRVDSESPKSRVYAFKDELDEWLRRTKHSRTIGQKNGVRRPSWKYILFIGIPALAAVGVILLLILPKISGPTEPTDFRIKGSTLIIINEKGRALWRYETGLENLWNEENYRVHFQFKKRSAFVKLPNLILKDIDRDGHKEILFTTQTEDETREGMFFCFDHKGRLLWPFKAGRQMKYGNKVYSGDYRIKGILADDLDDDGRLEVIICSVQRPDWPCQLVILRSDGSMVGEYWNTGHFGDFAFIDLNEDGVKEIVATGVNNEHRKGCVAVFDISAIRGGSPAISLDFQSADLEPGSEICYILFPRTDIDLAENYPTESVVSVDVLDNHRLSFKTDNSNIYYEFSYRLKPLDLILGNDFIQKHAQARLAGKVTSELNDEYKENLERSFLFWNGEKWTSEPTMNLRWNNQ